MNQFLTGENCAWLDRKKEKRERDWSQFSSFSIWLYSSELCNKICRVGIWGEKEREKRVREECKNVLTWQSTIKWGNVWSFITNTPLPHSLPPFLPCYPVLLGEIWEDDIGREGQREGGLRRPQYSFKGKFCLFYNLGLIFLVLLSFLLVMITFYSST